MEKKRTSPNGNDLVRVRYWVQDTLESGYWSTSCIMERYIAESGIESGVFERGFIMDVTKISINDDVFFSITTEKIAIHVNNSEVCSISEEELNKFIISLVKYKLEDLRSESKDIGNIIDLLGKKRRFLLEESNKFYSILNTMRIPEEIRK
jgi:hypothetical protein